MTTDFDDSYNEEDLTTAKYCPRRGEPTHVVNQVLNEGGETYLLPVGNAWCNKAPATHFEMQTIHGDFEVTPSLFAGEASQNLLLAAKQVNRGGRTKPTIH